MAGSSFGNLFRITTWGESHGKALGVVIDGCPAGLPLEAQDIQIFLDRRKPGKTAISTPRKEADEVERYGRSDGDQLRNGYDHDLFSVDRSKETEGE